MNSLQLSIGMLCIALYVTTVITLFVVLFSTCWADGRDSIEMKEESKNFPCGTCRYFTGEALLKCAVHPFTALTAECIECRDFELSL